MELADREVAIRGEDLKGKRIEFVVTGGVGAIESPKVIRELRRYSADVRVWMTRSAQEFISARVLEWASKNEVMTELSGSAEHISNADAAVVVPCSLNFLSKLSLGIADSPSLTCLQSLLARKPVLLQPSMHTSLAESPSFRQSLERIKELPKLHFLSALQEEGKWKVAEPQSLVAEICHKLAVDSFPQRRKKKILLCMGPTRSYLDDVRYLSNYSSGSLGLKIADTFYRAGYELQILSGPLSLPVPEYLRMDIVDESRRFHERALEIVKSEKFDMAIMAVALLDFEISDKRKGKLSSTQSLSLELFPRPKLISELRSHVRKLVGFKLEAGLGPEALEERIRQWNAQTDCDLVVSNLRSELSEENYRALLFRKNENTSHWLTGRKAVAHSILEFAADELE